MAGSAPEIDTATAAAFRPVRDGSPELGYGKGQNLSEHLQLGGLRLQPVPINPGVTGFGHRRSCFCLQSTQSVARGKAWSLRLPIGPPHDSQVP